MLLSTLMILAFAPHAWAAVTALQLNSEAGDFIGGGEQFSFTPADGAFMAQRNSRNGVSIMFSSPAHVFSLAFAAPNDELLAVGQYTGATRFPFQSASQPGLSVTGDGRGCNALTGSFTVQEAVYGAGDEITAFDASFEQHCEGAAPALRGRVQLNASGLVVTATTNAALFGIGDVLRLSVGVDNPGEAATADFYIGLLLPDGQTVVFFTNAGGAAVLGSLADLNTFRPIASGVSLVSPFSVTLTDFFVRAWTGTEPSGSYAAFIAVLRAGSLADLVVDPGDLLAVAVRQFAFQ